MTDVIQPVSLPVSVDESLELPTAPTARTSEVPTGVSSEQAELSRLRRLVGPEELDYVALRRENWRLRDELIAEAQRNGRLQSQVLSVTDQLETERRRANAALLVTRGRTFALAMFIVRVLRLPVRAARRLRRMLFRR
ncbi:MAG: hypothetical protein ACOYN3_01730 [Acidimicrobiia bacterium]